MTLLSTDIDLDPKPLVTYLSLGWGVQSWTLAAMVALGELPPITIALHSDTGHEMTHTYAHAAKWTPWLEERGVKVVTLKPPRTEVVRKEWGIGSIMIPAYTKDRDKDGEGTVPRQCTRIWKITPMRQHIRKLLPPGNPRPGAVSSWQGISLDEIKRMRSSDVKYITNVYPLVGMRMNRGDCINWLLQHGLDVPQKSSCTFCPFHTREQWRTMKRQGGENWEEALAADREIRDTRDHHELFVHSLRKPLEEAVRIPEDQGAHQIEMEMPCDGGVCMV